MKILVIGERLENHLFEIVKISKQMNCDTVFFKKNIKVKINYDDVIVIDSSLIDQLPKHIDNTVISVVSSVNYSPSLKNEMTLSLSSIQAIEKIIQNKSKNSDPIIVDPATKEIFQIAEKIAKSDATVLITGETGTGKEMLAKYIHQKSDRFDQKYVAINCAAIPETLLESELFGHEKGSFTHAIQKRIGKFEEASHGTILLDEISEMPMHLQAKLLRVIQEKEITRLGGVDIKINTRIIATSNKNLYQAISDGVFREDLFYRLNVIPIEVPKLNERPLDIEPLAIFFCRKYSDNKKTLSDCFLKSLGNYRWKGNIRELENLVHRTVLLSSDKTIDAAIFADVFSRRQQITPPPKTMFSM
ncbi:MAG: sigma-54 dependent transcriptional regulator [Holosporaceae bacterium]|jgi:transcriptional regulator with PAS, ATPase and Fis domain|nr:sigma-54 dependent transcriptional regulator [Holosporaceae bacterium]